MHEGWLNKISHHELLITVMNCKLQPRVACTKYQAWLNSLEAVGIHSFEDVWKDVGRDGKSGDWGQFKEFFDRCAGCGLDNFGRTVCWIRGKGAVAPQDEATFIRFPMWKLLRLLPHLFCLQA